MSVEGTQVKSWDRTSPGERIRFAGECGDKIHEGYSSYIEAGVSVPWGRMNHMMGCGTRWTSEVRDKYYTLLQQPAADRLNPSARECPPCRSRSRSDVGVETSVECSDGGISESISPTAAIMLPREG